MSHSANWLHSPLAIVGMACRLPGADGLEQFWELLQLGGYAVERMSDAKLDRGLYYHPEKGQRGKTYSDVGGFVQSRELDWSLLNIPKSQADDWDYCHLALCEVVAKACQHAGYDPHHLPHRNAGVFVGHSGGTTLGGDVAYRQLLDDYLELLAQIPDWSNLGKPEYLQQLRDLLVAGRPKRRDGGRPYVDAGFASGLISRNFQLHGPHMSIDAACASSLVALALGAMSLASGQTDLAIVGGASYNKADSLVLFSAAQSCSAQMSRPFDQHADGLISSEGYVAILMKRLDKAVSDGDQIQAVIRGVGYSSDGRGRSLWAPRFEGQVAAMERAYPDDVDPSTVQMIEAHATSTQVGDATEMEALASFYATRLAPGQKIPVGSVKSNIGHTLETAGLAGVVKAVLAIQHGTIPPSINLSTPSSSIPWDKLPFYVPTQAQPWPTKIQSASEIATLESELPRRAAVNAFGIGGLNVHVVVDQATLHTTAVPKQLQPRVVSGIDPIVVVGRGLVVPGAKDLQQFEQLLQASWQPTISSRWRNPVDQSLQSSSMTEVNRVTDASGLVRRVEFEYDWRKHKVPPKQVAHANPLQFMLLEAAEQALLEAGVLQSKVQRHTTAVVVGSIFGGDFGNSLFAGLRLPEFCDRMTTVLLSHGCSQAQSQQLAADFQQKFLDHFPALLDETGSFTSSTLASRIAKTFNLMGGAMAIDAGDVSSMASLQAACWLLQSGSVTSVVCAAAQRAHDKAALDNLRNCGRLSDGASYRLGEGAVAVVLKRQADAIRDGDKILAVIDDCGLAIYGNSISDTVQRSGIQALANGSENISVWGRIGVDSLDQSVAAALFNSDQICRLEAAPQLKITGHLQGAQGLADLVACTLDSQSSKHLLLGHTLSGQTGWIQLHSLKDTMSDAVGKHASNNRQQNRLTSDTLASEHAAAIRLEKSKCSDEIHYAGNLPVTLTSQCALVVDWELAGWEIGYWAADSLQQLAAECNKPGWVPNKSLPAHGRFVAAEVAPLGQLGAKAGKLSSMIANGASLNRLIDQGICWVDRQSLHAASKIAFVFSGQGSQYTGMLHQLAQCSNIAAQMMQAADEILRSIDGSSFSDMAWRDDNQLGENVWHTQASILVADTMLAATVRAMGLIPDLVAGHSYGEIPALLASGGLDLQTALWLTWHRCQCVAKHAPAGYAMLSVQADESTVLQAIQQSRLSVSISHINAPRQTVVGGKQAHVAQFAATLEDHGVSSRILPVPTAFHTSSLQPAVAPFRQALDRLPIDTPRIPFLSSVNNRFMSDPELIRDNLAEQLVTPIRFVDLVKRVVGQSVHYVIEIGPQRILTRLMGACQPDIQLFSSDGGPHVDHPALSLQPLALLQAWACLCGRKLSSDRRDTVPPSNSRQVIQVRHFDATSRRRQRLKQQSQNRLQEHSVNPLHQVALGQPRMDLQPLVEKQTKPQEFDKRMDQSIHPPAASQVLEIQQILIDFVVEQTGYPVEIVELDADLEADLGIDSIKKAQLLGELRELFPHALSAANNNAGGVGAISRDRLNASSGSFPKTGRGQLDDLRTLRDFVSLLTASGIAVDPGASHKPTAIDSRPTEATSSLQPTSTEIAKDESGSVGSLETKVAERIQHTVTPAKEISSQAKSHFSRDSLRRFVVDFVVEQTGYPKEIVELDADLEADLGIDSIKKAQLLGELRETFSVQLVQSDAGGKSSSAAALDNLRTLNQILDLLATRLGCIDSPSNETFQQELIASPLDHTVQPDRQNPGQDDPKLDAVTTSVVPCMKEASVLPCFGLDRESEFTEAVLHNLRSMPTRVTQVVEGCGNTLVEDSQVGHHANDRQVMRWTLDQLSVGKTLADQLRVPVESLMALDHLLTEQSQWKLISKSEDIGCASSRCALELTLPGWLSQNHCAPLGLIADWMGVTALLPPGSLTPLAVVDRKDRLFVVGADSCEARVALSTRLAELAGTNSNEVSAILRSWKTIDDWWLVVVDPVLFKVFHYQSHQQIFSQSVDSMDHWTIGELTIHQVGARLGYDASQRCWVVAAKSAPLQSSHLFKVLVPATTSGTAVMAQADAVSDQEAGFSFFKAFDPQVELPIKAETSGVAQRYVLRMVPASSLEVQQPQPTWSGGAVVVGRNPIADALCDRLSQEDVPVFRMETSDLADDMELAEQFKQLAEHRHLNHLFIASPCDSEAQLSLDGDSWLKRRRAGLMNVFWLCQKWFEHITQNGRTDDASLIAVSSMGGDFGISGNLYSAEGGGVNGLLKSILIESWMQGYRSLPIKTIDTSPMDSPQQVVEQIWRELAIPSYDNEIAYRNGVRHVLKAISQPIEKAHLKDCSQVKQNITRGGVWVCSGGARGITALAAEHLALKYDLTLHLLGTAPAPNIDESWRDLDAEGLRQLKLRVMTEARSIGKNPVKHWQDTEKQLEIDATLRRFQQMGIRAHYHSCDVSNRQQVNGVLGSIRAQSGVIRGVLHGAGIGRDSRFERKQPDKVNECVAAKIDGALALMDATRDDPLEAFIGFGSISGRFGANGHTDYSLANEMLCKQIDWLKHLRPEVKAIGFHWHAWGDVGMATKPETRLALEMIHMQFMPAEEGIQHLLNELESASDDSEVLITDDRYYRAFYPADCVAGVESDTQYRMGTPLLSPRQSSVDQGQSWIARVNPAQDPFLTEHQLDGHPILPMVIASEMMFEAAAATWGTKAIVLQDITAHAALKFFGDGEQELRLATRKIDGVVQVELRAAFVSRKGQVVDPDRLHFSARAVPSKGQQCKELMNRLQLPAITSWQSVHYPSAEAEFYVGWPLQKLRKFAITEQGLLGKISAPALIELAGVTRDTQGWAIPCAALDACLFAVGILAWQKISAGSALPVRLGELKLGRLPRPGEALVVHVRQRESKQKNHCFDFALVGVDGTLILEVTDYEIAWLHRSNLNVARHIDQLGG